jgi:eukaryotic-like serine/threonine-protein kinase
MRCEPHGSVAQMIGRVLAKKYRLEAEIGAGAMGRVYRACQVDLARDVAVKLLHPMMAADEGARLRFAREAKVAARLSHPGAVAVLDFGLDEGVPFLVMELMEGETLRQRLGRGPIARADAIGIISEVADALVAAHEIRLIHRDLKPENTFLQHTSSGERVRVVDFGLAFLATDEAAVGRLTQDGYVGGTPAYMSPEQVHGRGVGPAADIYSLGCMFYELIAGHPPFRGSLAELLTSQAYAPPRSLRLLDVSPPVALELDRLILAMLAKSAPTRPSPSAVWQALRDLVADTPSRASAPAYVSERSARALHRPSGSATARRPGGLLFPGEQGSHTEPREIARGSTQDMNAGNSADLTLATGMHRREPVCVVVIGELPEEVEFGLLSAGCAIEHEDALDRADVIWAPGISDARIAHLTTYAPVVTNLGDDTGASDEDKPGSALAPLMLRLRAGAADLMIGEFSPDQLAHKLIRLGRRAKAAT